MMQQNQITAADDVTDPTKPAPKVQNTAVPGATGNPSAPPMTPPAATPTPIPTNTAPMTPPAMPAPTVGPALQPQATAQAAAINALPGATGNPATPAPTSVPAAAPASFQHNAANIIQPSDSPDVVSQKMAANAQAQGMVLDPKTGAYEQPDSQQLGWDTGAIPTGDTIDQGSYDAQGNPHTTRTQENGIATGSVPTANAPTIAPAAAPGGYVNASGLSTPNVPTEVGGSASASPSPSAPVIGAASGGASGVNTAAIDPSNDLRGQTVLPGAESNRLDIANRELKNYEDQALPQFRNKLRSTYQNNAALGRNGSGMLRTDVGNLDLAEQNAYNAKKTSLLDAALGDTIGDNRANRDEYRTERGREDALEGQAYDRGIQGLTLEDALTNSSFGRALAQNSAGQANNPAQTQLLLSQIFGQQSSQAGNALSNMIRGNAANGVTGGQSGINPADVWAWIQKNLPNGGATVPGDTSGSDGMS